MRTIVDVDVAGLGIILYSPFAVTHIREGQDYLTARFWKPADVAEHVVECGLTTFCVGSPGRYQLTVYDGVMDAAALERAEKKIRLGLEVRDGRFCVRDVYDLLAWRSDCPSGQLIMTADGFYRITAYTSAPPSGIVGDGQQIALHFESVQQKPALHWTGVPDLTCE